MKINYKVIPQNKTAKVGETVTFTCKSDFIPTWYYNGGSLPPNTLVEIGSTTSIYKLIIHQVQFHNGGTYLCQGRDEDLYSFHEGLSKLYFEDEGELTVVARGKLPRYLHK